MVLIRVLAQMLKMHPDAELEKIAARAGRRVAVPGNGLEWVRVDVGDFQTRDAELAAGPPHPQMSALRTDG